ncbi:MAG: DinB family protein [Citrobacter freundii]|nr:MAG: DinB family protein [Citrobacter freundii]
MTTIQTAQELQLLIEQHIDALRAIDHATLKHKPIPDKWSKQEIIGHLADSAQNNLRRFIVAQYEDNPTIVYNQDKWVNTSGYQQQPGNEIIELWFLLNKQICHILRNMNEEAAQRICTTSEPHPINWLAEDYNKHLKHHLHQVLDLEPFVYPQ